MNIFQTFLITFYLLRLLDFSFFSINLTIIRPIIIRKATGKTRPKNTSVIIPPTALPISPPNSGVSAQYTDKLILTKTTIVNNFVFT